jgi:hypothetical protein
MLQNCPFRGRRKTPLPNKKLISGIDAKAGKAGWPLLPCHLIGVGDKQAKVIAGYARGSGYHGSSGHAIVFPVLFFVGIRGKSGAIIDREVLHVRKQFANVLHMERSLFQKYEAR